MDDGLDGENIGRGRGAAAAAAGLVVVLIGSIMIYRSPTAVNGPTDRLETGEVSSYTFMRQNQHRNKFLVSLGSF